MSCPTWSRTSCSWMAVMVFSSGGGLGWVVGRGAVVRVGAGGSARRGDAGRGTTGGWGATVGVGRLREQRVAGLVDGGGDVGLVDGLVGGDGDGAGLDVDGDGLYSGDGADRGGDGVAAVVAGHALDPEGLGPDERRGGVGGHAFLLGSVVRAVVLSVLVMAGRSRRRNRRVAGVLGGTTAVACSGGTCSGSLGPLSGRCLPPVVVGQRVRAGRPARRVPYREPVTAPVPC